MRLRYWLNVDKPTRKCVIHREGCTYEMTKRETPLKGVEEIKRDGGWLIFPSQGEAINITSSQLWMPSEDEVASSYR